MPPRDGERSSRGGRDGNAPGEHDAGGADGDRPGGLRLDDALKLAGVAATGGLAKRLIQAGEVLVNGQVETRRKRVLRPGDVIEVGGESFEIDLEDA